VGWGIEGVVPPLRVLGVSNKVQHLQLLLVVVCWTQGAAVLCSDVSDRGDWGLNTGCG
jgi:hypothetical protein